MASILPADMHVDGSCAENGREKAWLGGMENAYDQGRIGGKRWTTGANQKKIPCRPWVCALLGRQGGKKFPDRITDKAVILLTNGLFLWSQTIAGIKEMQKIMTGLLLIGCCGCSAGMHTDLVEVEMRLASPRFGEAKRVPVVYPGRSEVSGESMVQAFGPSWRSMENDYPAYNFNP